MDGERFFLIDKVLEKRMKKIGKYKYTYEYLVKWTGYGEEDNEWLPEERVTEFAIREYERKQKEKTMIEATKDAEETPIDQNQNIEKTGEDTDAAEKGESGNETDESTQENFAFDELPDALINLEDAAYALQDIGVSNQEMENINEKSCILQTYHSTEEDPASTPQMEKSNSKAKRSKGKRPTSNPLEKTADETSDEGSVYDVEYVWDHRIVRGAHQYKVKWVGHEFNENEEWIPEENFMNCKQMLDGFREKQASELADEKLTVASKRLTHKRQLPTLAAPEERSQINMMERLQLQTEPRSQKRTALSKESSKRKEPPAIVDESTSTDCDRTESRRNNVSRSKASTSLKPPKWAKQKHAQKGTKLNNLSKSSYESNRVVDSTKSKRSNMSCSFVDDVPAVIVQNALLKLARCPSCCSIFMSTPKDPKNAKLYVPVMSHNCNHTICAKCIATMVLESSGRREQEPIPCPFGTCKDKCQWHCCPVPGCNRGKSFSMKHLNKNNSVVNFVKGIKSLFAGS